MSECEFEIRRLWEIKESGLRDERLNVLDVKEMNYSEE